MIFLFVRSFVRSKMKYVPRSPFIDNNQRSCKLDGNGKLNWKKGNINGIASTVTMQALQRMPGNDSC